MRGGEDLMDLTSLHACYGVQVVEGAAPVILWLA